MSSALVSIIIPAYNAEPYIEGTIRSALDQTHGALEVIVIDDGSTDGTVAMVNAIKDPRLRIVSQPNGGVSVARNNGMDMARGEYIALLDADDTLEPEAIELKVQALRSPGIDWVFSDVLACNAEMEAFGIMRGKDDDIIRTTLLGIESAVPGPCSNLVFSRSCFLGGIRFQPQLSNAADKLFVLMLAKSYRHKRIPRALFRYRILPTSMSRNVALFEADHRRLMQAAADLGLFEDRVFERTCLANAEWAIGGSWWRDGNAPMKGLPHLLRAIMLDPKVLMRRLSRERSGRTAIEPLSA